MTHTEKGRIERRIDFVNGKVNANEAKAKEFRDAGDDFRASRHERIQDLNEAKLEGILDSLSLTGFCVDFYFDENDVEKSRVKVAPRPYDESISVSADRVCTAIRQLAANEDAMNCFGNYLSRHFDTWLAFYASTPENMAEELERFACTLFPVNVQD